jgi:hypothetical protein
LPPAARAGAVVGRLGISRKVARGSAADSARARPEVAAWASVADRRPSILWPKEQKL